MIKIGMVIGGRYEVVEKIGTGGMSDVYRAKDHKLNRFVAIKVLKQEFSENTSFVSKFRTEAQATAGLMHPNIVNVYDVGDENGIYYIVMELIEGITLKKYIEKKIRLSFKEAVSIAIQVSMGIEAAHNNHIIHRDIKPQNIIISKDGKVKVADFGIAKAASSNTITSNVMGSVHYTSPEQARGGFSDEKSDIYSLGVTIFEMLTGRVPFNGETTVAIAIKHIQEEMPTPRNYVEDIPVSIEKIILKCTKKSPDRRYQNMQTLIDDLKHSLLAPDEDFVNMDEQDILGETKVATETRVRKNRPDDSELVTLKAVKPRDRETTNDKNSERDLVREKNSEKPKEKNKSGSSSGERKNKASGQSDHKSSGERARKASGDKKKSGRSDTLSRSKSKKKYDIDEQTTWMDRIVTVAAVVTAVIIGIVVLMWVANKMGFSEGMNLGFLSSEDEGKSSVKKEMPDVIGTSVDRANEMLEKAGFSDVEITYKESDKEAPGVVMECNIKIGRMVPVDTHVVLTVSSGKEGTGISVTDVLGMTSAEATAMLEKAGFVVEKKEVASEHVEKGCVADQNPGPGEKAPRGSTVTIMISNGLVDGQIAVPNLNGLSEMDATVLLTETGLTVGQVEEVNTEDSVNIDVVCEQSEKAGDFVDPGTAIDLKINIGPAETTYSFNSSVESPQAEDNAYIAGGACNVILVASDGSQLFSSTGVTSFPIAINVSGIKGSSSGTIVIQYLASSTQTDPNTGETIPGEPAAKEVHRSVSFKEE